LPSKLTIYLVIANASRSPQIKATARKRIRKTMRNPFLTHTRKLFFSPLLSLCLTVAGAAQAKPPLRPAVSQEEVIRQLLQCLQDLEAELQQIEAHSAATAQAAIAGSAPFLALASLPLPAAEQLLMQEADIGEFAEKLNEPSPGARYDFASVSQTDGRWTHEHRGRPVHRARLRTRRRRATRRRHAAALTRHH
jgi:hypothetical protein